MINRRAETSFWSGMQLLEVGRPRDAAVFFKAAIELAKSDELSRSQARYLSYYGPSLCLARNGFREALSSCRMATRLENDRPELWRNLGRVAITLGRRGEAYRAWQRGLELDPNHAGIQDDLRRLGVRSKPALPFLSRHHPLNVAMGRFRSACMSSRKSAGSRMSAGPKRTVLLATAAQNGSTPVWPRKTG